MTTHGDGATITAVPGIRVGRTAAVALARRINPANTPLYGDLIFAVSTSQEYGDVGAVEVLALGIALGEILEGDIIRSATVER